jgi:hypothetical protein
MQQVISQNRFYQIAINKSINRAYITIIGFWRNKQEAASYLPDLEKALAQLKPGFTLLTDLTQMKTHPAEVQDVHLAAQALLLRKGLIQTAEIISSSLVQFQTDKISKNSKMPLRQFTSQQEATSYLDTVVAA